MASKQPDTRSLTSKEQILLFQCDLYLNTMLISNIGLKEECKRLRKE